MAEWSKAPVLKTGVSRGTQGSNPCPSAILTPCSARGFLFLKGEKLLYGKVFGKPVSEAIKSNDLAQVNTDFLSVTTIN
jgi:hypothetical protein